MRSIGTHTLTNSQDGNLAVKVFGFSDNSHFDHVVRKNYYTLLIVRQGSGRFKSDFSSYTFQAPAQLGFGPYQPFMLEPAKEIEGFAIQFHPDFFCIHKHHTAISCDGVLFNNIYQPPVSTLRDAEVVQLEQLALSMAQEIDQAGLAHGDSLVAYLKLVLVTSSRIRARQLPDLSEETTPEIASRLQDLKTAIEENFRRLHSPAAYADLLNISAKALAKATKQHFQKTLSDLISERIVIEAKRELYLTSKPVKTIAHELGFDDEYYFSRFFKNNADVSPALYRQSVGFARGEA